MSEEKNPPRAQILRYFRYESRNNKFSFLNNQTENKQALLFSIPKKSRIKLSHKNCKANKTARISGQNPECSYCPLIHIEKLLGKENDENLYILDNIKV